MALSSTARAGVDAYETPGALGSSPWLVALDIRYQEALALSGRKMPEPDTTADQTACEVFPWEGAPAGMGSDQPRKGDTDNADAGNQSQEGKETKHVEQGDEH